MMKKYKYIILGSGIASYGALEEIKKKSNDVLIITDSKLCYLKPLLSKTAFTCYNLNLTYLPDIYNSIDIIYEKIISIDIQNKVINNKYQYEYCIYALGAISRRLNIQQPTYYLRTPEDFYAIKRKLPFIDSVAVVGGGNIGIEIAVMLSKTGKNITIYEAASSLMSRYLTKSGSDYLIDLLNKLNIQVYCDSHREKYDEDMIIACIGNERFNLFNKPIKVDEYLEFDNQIYACGDCVEGNAGLWDEAYLQGQIAGKNVTGGYIEYKPKDYPLVMHVEEFGIYSSLINTNKEYDEIRENTFVSLSNSRLTLIGDTSIITQLMEELE